MTDGSLDATDPRTLPGFFDALADGDLLGGVCADCGQVLYPPRPPCYACGSRAVDVEPQSREGRVFSYTAVHTPPPAFAADAPYTVAVVELADGGRLLGRVAADYADVDGVATVNALIVLRLDGDKEYGPGDGWIVWNVDTDF